MAVAETGQSQTAADRVHVFLHDRIDLLLTVVRTASDGDLVAALAQVYRPVALFSRLMGGRHAPAASLGNAPELFTGLVAPEDRRRGTFVAC
ncbi:hypothetical protein ADK76_10735 [Streptomyces griseoflavus]|uniref:hypothetical protein n=1 Tax=Streptomyces rimosus TaxID=1927 RepID=UPI0004C67297|nr:hypothetical protein [Streptomyces rimosus]KOG63984.1 hypothetical protein ADK76_10735 [Streptomyces griseoflavus]